MTPEDVVRLFGMSHQLIESDLDRVEKELGLDLGRRPAVGDDKDEDYYPQFERSIRDEASRMSKHYEVIYTLERTIRAFVADALEDVEPEGWWKSTRVPDAIKNEVANRMKREAESGFTVRSDDPLDFTTFGELGEIVKNNWDVFGSMLNDKKAVEKIMANLNTLRGPIAHCSELAEDEETRLRLSVRDWFRQLAARST
jgi:Swt1-like HEPN